MARVSPTYEARAKVSDSASFTAAASVTTFFLASVTTFLVASCGPNSSQPTYDAAISGGADRCPRANQSGRLRSRDSPSWMTSDHFGASASAWRSRHGQMPNRLHDVRHRLGEQDVCNHCRDAARGSGRRRTLTHAGHLPAGLSDGCCRNENITVDVLNHSSGSRAADYRNALIRSPAPDIWIRSSKRSP